MTRIIFVVSPDQVDLISGLARENPAENVEIVIDRRRRDRRRISEATRFEDRRHVERRKHSTSWDLQLLGIGVTVVP